MTRSSPVTLLRLGAALLVASLAVAAARDAEAAPPAVRAKQEQARLVIAQINAINIEVGRTVERWNGARYELERVRARLAQTRRDLAQARHEHLSLIHI